MSANTSLAIKTAAVLQPVAILFQVIGFATNYWFYFKVDNTSNEVFVGIWDVCSCPESGGTFGGTSNIDCVCMNALGYRNIERASMHLYKTVQAMETIGLVAIGISFFLVMMDLSASWCYARKVWATSLSFLAGVCILIGVCIFGAETSSSYQKIFENLGIPEEVFKDYGSLHFSFAFCVIAAALCCACGAVLVCDIVTNGNAPSRQPHLPYDPPVQPSVPRKSSHRPYKYPESRPYYMPEGGYYVMPPAGRPYRDPYGYY